MFKSTDSADLRRMVTERQTMIALFSGKWCPDCTGFEPTWREWTDSRTQVASYQVEVPRDGDEWEDWNLDEIPTVILFSGGLELGRLAGNIDFGDLDVMVHNHTK